MSYRLNGSEYIADFESAQQRLWDGIGQTVPYESKRVVEYARALFELSPVKVDDVVEIVDPPVITTETSWGWLCAKHLFVVGARGKVVAVDYRDGSFIVGFTFDRETWIDHQGVERPVGSPAIFNLAARRLRRIDVENAP